MLLVDTAGRLAIDEKLMAEIRELHAALKPVETLFVVDAMQGQDAINTAKAFKEALPLTGIVLTKMDGDSRGGAALSVRGDHRRADQVRRHQREDRRPRGRSTPQRHAGRILGMGDIVGLVEEVAEERRRRRGAEARRQGQGRRQLRSERLPVADFTDEEDGRPGRAHGQATLAAVRRAAQLGPAEMDRAERDVRRMEGIICSMTPLERRKPELLKATRKRRIASGAGVQVQDVNRLLNQFEQMRDMMKKMKGGGMMKMMKRMGGMKGLGGMR